MSSSKTSLIRVIGRWSLTAGIINGVIGSGIFGLPAAVAGLVGAWSPLAVLIAGCCIFVIVLCFAEVGSRFEEAGGPYLYAREAFGPMIGFQVGWLLVWTRLLTGAAVLNVLVSYLGLLVPAAATSVGRIVVMTIGMALVTAINVIGVRQTAWTINIFTIAKLAPLFLLIVFGGFYLSPNVFAAQPVDAPNWTEAILLLVFAYGGFESAVIAASEARNPKRDMAFALIVGIAVITVVYCLVQLVIVGTVPQAAENKAPVAAALNLLFGAPGLTLGSLAVVISVYGWLTSFALMTPRVLYSMAERGELPGWLARVHEQFRTPHVAILLNSVVALGLGFYNNFAQAAVLAAIARLGIYVLTCASLIILRRRSPESQGFRLPGGNLFALLGIAFGGWLLGTRNFAQAWFLLAIFGTGLILWLLRKNFASETKV